MMMMCDGDYDGGGGGGDDDDQMMRCVQLWIYVL